MASYKAAEKILADGRARGIGVCNFSPKHLSDLIAQTKVVPAVNQVELHPFFIQREVREADARDGMITQSWSPLGGVNVVFAVPVLLHAVLGSRVALPSHHWFILLLSVVLFVVQWVLFVRRRSW